MKVLKCLALLTLVVALVGTLTSCGSVHPLAVLADDGRPTNGIALLIDVSGSYDNARPAAVELADRKLVDELNEGDCLAALKIGAQGFSDGEILADCLSASDKPIDSANVFRNRSKKVEWKNKIRNISSMKSERKSDIEGSLANASLLLRGLKSDQKWLIVFSDLKKNIEIKMPDGETLKNVTVRVYCFPKDGLTPSDYLRQTELWTSYFKRHGASDVRFYSIAETRLKTKLLE